MVSGDAGIAVQSLQCGNVVPELRYWALWRCNALQYRAVWHGAVQLVAVQSDMAQCGATRYSTERYDNSAV
ncbi:hypothetical protein PAENIP36_68240 [Paenibacillus sp. P36]